MTRDNRHNGLLTFTGKLHENGLLDFGLNTRTQYNASHMVAASNIHLGYYLTTYNGKVTDGSRTGTAGRKFRMSSLRRMLNIP